LTALLLLLACLPAAQADQDQAMSYFNSGKYLEAAGEFQALADEHPDYAFAYFMLGNCFLKTDKLDDAEKNYLKAIELNGEDFRYHYQLASTYAQHNKSQKVIGTLNNAEALATSDQYKQVLYKLRGQARYSTKDWAGAIEDLARVKPDADTQLRLAKASFQVGDPKTLERLKAATKSNPKDASLRKLETQALMDKAATSKSDAEKKRLYEEAVTSANAYLALKPGTFEGNNLVGLATLGAGQYEKAAQSFTKALQKDTDNCNTMINQGKALMAQQDWVNGSKSFENATKCDPKMAMAWENKAYTLQKQEKLESAIQSYDKALSLNPDSAFAAKNIEVCRKNIEIRNDNLAMAKQEAAQEAEADEAQREFEEAQAKQQEWEKRQEEDD
jgi:tetratricopeptide (TPR) repeat protein